MNQELIQEKHRVFFGGRLAIVKVLASIALSITMFSSTVCFATTFADGKIKLSGFGSIGAVSADTDEIGFKRDISDTNPTYKGDINTSSLSNLGLQTNFYINDKLDIISQVFFYDQPEFDADALIKIAAVNFRPTPQWQIRLGRTPPRFYLRSDTHHISYVNAWTMPVQELYSPVTARHIDGIDLSYSIAIGNSFLEIGAFYGDLLSEVSSQGSGDFELKLNEFHGLVLEYSQYNWEARLSVSQSDNGENWQQLDDLIDLYSFGLQQIGSSEGDAALDSLSLEESAIQYTSAGVIYDDGKYAITGEYGLVDTDNLIFPSSRLGYISVGRHLGRLMPFAMYAFSRTDESVRLLELFPPELELVLTGLVDQPGGVTTGYRQRSASLGVRWDATARIAIKAQWDVKMIDRGGYTLWSRGPDIEYPDGSLRVNVFSMRMDFIF